MAEEISIESVIEQLEELQQTIFRAESPIGETLLKISKKQATARDPASTLATVLCVLMENHVRLVERTHELALIVRRLRPD